MPEDLEHFLEPEKAQQAFDVLDVDGDGQVTLHNIRDAVVNIYQVWESPKCVHVLRLSLCSWQGILVYIPQESLQHLMSILE